MKLSPQDLEKIVDLTLEHYNRNAEDFHEGTQDHDVSQNIAALLKYIEGKAPFTILDFGCGPGRDLKAFAELGHVPSQELPRVLRELHATLKPRGVLFSSNPHGHNEESWNRGRYGAFYDLETWCRYMSAASFAELTHYYRPAGVPRAQQPWLASVWRRMG
jgi:SAM-dependent methyltransferase